MSHESFIDNIEAAVISAGDRHDVRDLFLFSPDRGGVRAIKLRNQLSAGRNQKRAAPLAAYRAGARP